MRRRARPSLAILLLIGAGCTAPAFHNFSATDDAPEPGATTTPATGGTTTLAPGPTTGLPTTTEPAAGTTSAGGDGTGPPSTTTGDPLAAPLIVDHDLAPALLDQPGPIHVTLATAHADGVRMQVDGGGPVELTSAEADVFHGDITFYTALDNGDHEAVFVAWRDALESAPLHLTFAVALPEAGSELHWHGDGALGPGYVAALAVTPDDHVIEFGTYYPKGQAKCYLRRRDLGGAWSWDGVRDLVPDSPCTAIDLAVDAAGRLHLLADRHLDGELRWWLGRLDAWDADAYNLASGAPGDDALALALADPRIAVCGTTPTAPGLDAAAWLFSPNQPGKVLSFPYTLAENPLLTFDETARDCTFAGDRLVLAGEARGRHDGDNIVRERHFILEVDIPTGDGTFAVAGPGPGTQSRAQAVAVDAEGRYITGGYTCADACLPRGELRLSLPGGAQIWQRALDPAIAGPRALGSHPAGYLVYVSSRTQDPDTAAFFAEAWFPLSGVPAWSYQHTDGPALHAAHALAIGPFGQIYAGGTTANGYPAVAFIAP